jgi:hypothetical protein
VVFEAVVQNRRAASISTLKRPEAALSRAIIVTRVLVVEASSS